MPWLGGALWLSFVLLVQPGWSAALFLLAPLVAIPLAVELARIRFFLPSNQYLFLGAVPAAASYIFDQGLPAALLAVPWFVLTLWLAWMGWLGLLNGRNLPMSFGLMYLAVGGGWLMLARLGARPLDFPDVIVQATATHFHFAGCVLPVLMGVTVERLPSLWNCIVGWAIVAGVPLVAAGITLSAFGIVWLEALAAWFLAASCWGFAVVQGRLAWQEKGWHGTLLGLSSLSLALAMVLAALYGARLFWHVAWLEIPTMLRYHGTLQALGFALPALLAWHRITSAEMDWIFPWLGQRPKLERWEQRTWSANVEQGPGAGDRRDCHKRVVAAEAPGPPETDGPFRRLTQAIRVFDIFPPRLVEAVVRRQSVEVGDTVGLSYRFLPGWRLFFAARVSSVFDEATEGGWRAGFAYRTLAGHPMCGEETFSVEKDTESGQILVALRSWSRPDSWLVRCLYPLARRWQVQAARSALEHLQLKARSERETINQNLPGSTNGFR